MKTSTSPWDDATTGWVPLGILLSKCEAELHIMQREAVKILRPALESGKLGHRLVQEPAHLAGDDGIINADTAILEPGVIIPRAAPPTTVEDAGGWSMVDWTQGLSGNCTVVVSWWDVMKLLEPQATSRPPVVPASSDTAKIRIVPDRGGVTEREFWKAFDRELVRATWDQDFSSRRGCVSLMKKWVEIYVENPPDDARVRARVNALLPGNCPSDDPPIV